MTETAKLEALIGRLRKRTERVHDLSGVSYNDDEDCHLAADAIETLLRTLSRPAVKGLEWHGPDVNGDIYAKSLLGTYTVRAQQGSLGFWLTQVGGYHATVEAAQAVAQRHFDKSILSALSSLSPPTGGWRDAKPDGLEAAIADFKAKLPGWWYSVGECQVSCDASCAPTVESEHIGLIQHSDDPFDSGFHADLQQPSTLAEALRTVMRDALSEIEVRTALTKKEGQ